MPPKARARAKAKPRARAGGRAGGKAPELKQKSPAEFFAEHQNIAGFDNPGKSLYTTVREFVENALDACEMAGTLPDVRVEVRLLSAEEFGRLRGVDVGRDRIDTDLYSSREPAPGPPEPSPSPPPADAASQASQASQQQQATPASAAKAKRDRKAVQYFRVTCRDNGVGMPHEEVPEMLGVVLSSTKYGVKQTRGKFGLGAKMALVWSKKSTGLPIEVTTCQDRGGELTRCRLDLDIHRNRPQVLEHVRVPNEARWRGTEISVVIAGNFGVYQGKVKNYMRQLAIITPYARMELAYTGAGARGFSLRFARRSEQMPPAAAEVRHHPSSVDNLLVERLLAGSRAPTVRRFLTGDLSSITPALASRLLAELGPPFADDMARGELAGDASLVHRLVKLLKQAKFPPPSPGCLSPVGEYNLRLGIMKELAPDHVATWTSDAGVHEGHPFVVEAAVSIGGNEMARPGITVFRFANRIPLLFEGGSDVATVVANKRIRWANYKINSKQDRIGVFLSIVSTRVPFKGTSKEYIGDDRGPIHEAVKKALTQCCLQLKTKLVRDAARKASDSRKRNLARYIPDVSRALLGVLGQMADPDGGAAQYGPHAPPAAKRRRLREDARAAELADDLVPRVAAGSLTERALRAALEAHVNRVDASLAMEAIAESGGRRGGRATARDDAHMVPLPPGADALGPRLYAPHFSVRLLWHEP